MSLQTLQELLYFLIRRLGVRSRTRISYPVKAVRCWRSLLTRTLFTDLIRLYQSVPASTLTTRKQEDVYTELSLSFLDKCALIIIKCWSFYKFVLVKVTLISAPICGKTLTIKSS